MVRRYLMTQCPLLYIYLQPATTCPNREYPITRYILHLHNTLTNSTSSHPLPPPTFPDLALVVYLNSSDGAIVEDSHYVYHIIVESRAGSVASESREMGEYEGGGREIGRLLMCILLRNNYNYIMEAGV